MSDITNTSGTVVQASKEKPVYDGGLAKTIILKHPFTLAGRRYSSVTVKPCSVGDFNAARAAEKRLPMYYDQNGELLSEDALDAMTLRDNARLNEAAASFLPSDSDEAENSSQSEPGKVPLEQ